MEHFVTDFQEFKASTAERIYKIERVMEKCYRTWHRIDQTTSRVITKWK